MGVQRKLPFEHLSTQINTIFFNLRNEILELIKEMGATHIKVIMGMNAVIVLEGLAATERKLVKVQFTCFDFLLILLFFCFYVIFELMHTFLNFFFLLKCYNVVFIFQRFFYKLEELNLFEKPEKVILKEQVRLVR